MKKQPRLKSYFKKINGIGFLSDTVFLVQYINRKVKIPCKCDPQQIGDLQVSCNGLDFYEFDYHCQYNRPQSNQPYECKKECPHIKEDYAPEKVEKKVERIYG